MPFEDQVLKKSADEDKRFKHSWESHLAVPSLQPIILKSLHDALKANPTDQPSTHAHLPAEFSSRQAGYDENDQKDEAVIQKPSLDATERFHAH